MAAKRDACLAEVDKDALTPDERTGSKLRAPLTLSNGNFVKMLVAAGVLGDKVGAKAAKGKGGKGGKGARMRSAMKKHSSVNGFKGIAAATAAGGKRGRLRRRGSVACLAAFKKDIAKQQRAGAFALDKNAHVQQRENDHCHNTTCIFYGAS